MKRSIQEWLLEIFAVFFPFIGLINVIYVGVCKALKVSENNSITISLSLCRALGIIFGLLQSAKFRSAFIIANPVALAASFIGLFVIDRDFYAEIGLFFAVIIPIGLAVCIFMYSLTVVSKLEIHIESKNL